MWSTLTSDLAVKGRKEKVRTLKFALFLRRSMLEMPMITAIFFLKNLYTWYSYRSWKLRTMLELKRTLAVN